MIRGPSAIALIFLTDVCSATRATTFSIETITLWIPERILTSAPFFQLTQPTNTPLDVPVATTAFNPSVTYYNSLTTGSRPYTLVASRASYYAFSSVSPLHNLVATEGSDRVGFQEVSGLYGPGAWSGWFLTVVGAWWQILLHPSEAKFSINTWSFLVGMNWAAADLLRCIRLINEAPTYTNEWLLLGSYAAAFNVTFWGLFHVVMQLVFSLFMAKNAKRVRQRLWTLLASIVLPLIALSAAFCQLSPRLINSLPAVYWDGMDLQIHKKLFEFTASSFMFLLPGFLIFAYLKGDKYLSCPLIATVRSTVSEAWNSLPGSKLLRNSFTRSAIFYIFIRIPVFVVFLFIWMSIYEFVDNVLWFVALGLPFVLFRIWAFAMMGPLLWLLWILNSSLKYVFEGYVRHKLRVSKSCFFMPCAPQPITDEDQLYPLGVGLASLLIFDIGPAVYKKYKPQVALR